MVELDGTGSSTSSEWGAGIGLGVGSGGSAGGLVFFFVGGFLMASCVVEGRGSATGLGDCGRAIDSEEGSSYEEIL